jgi:hypothetical protein
MAAHVDHLARSRIAALVARRSDGLVDRADAAEPNQDQAAAHKMRRAQKPKPCVRRTGAVVASVRSKAVHHRFWG